MYRVVAVLAVALCGLYSPTANASTVSAAQSTATAKAPLAAWGQGGGERGHLSMRLLLDEEAGSIDVAWWEFVQPR